MRERHHIGVSHSALEYTTHDTKCFPAEGVANVPAGFRGGSGSGKAGLREAQL